jgi:hypothetical protein
MASVDQTSREQRQENMGSDETALQERRRIQKIVRVGDERSIPELINTLCQYLKTGSSQNARGIEPAAIAAIKGLATLVDPTPSQVKEYKTILAEKKLTAEQVVRAALNVGNNRVQGAAAEALGVIGSYASRDELIEREQFDKSASVRARCKMALRRIERRFKPTSGNSSFSAAVKTAYMSPDIDVIKEWDDDNEAEINVSLADEDQLGVAARSQRVRITGHNDPRMESQRTAFQDGLDYLVVSTVCGTASEKSFNAAMKMNGQRLASATLTKPFQFVQGSLGVFEGNLILLQTLPNSFVTIQTIRQAIESIAQSGDQIENRLTGGQDTQ